MTVDLTQPITWSNGNAEVEALLADLQCNILKGHGRPHVTLLFLKLSSPAPAKSFLKSLGQSQVTDALTQLKEAKAHQTTGKDGGTIVACFLTAAGYSALGIAAARIPPDPAFKAGMSKRSLKDPPLKQWEAGLKGTLHALILIADSLEARVANKRFEIEEQLSTLKAGAVVFRQDGNAMVNANNHGIEHFGYVDGRSQPLLLSEDVNDEPRANWDPTFAANIALVKDPGSANANAFGSYFIFRKLEQNVRGFKLREKALAKKLGLTGDDAERAGAMVVGRFEDGTPVVLQDHDKLPVDATGQPVNDFEYGIDAGAGKCPFHGHIRKANPRGDTVRKLGATLASERSHIMARRGIPYGTRATHPNDPALDDHPTLMPTKGVGLLFMAYNVDIARQFEFTQSSWVNNPGFAQGTGIDPVIGQGANPAGSQKWPKMWGQPDKDPATGFDFSGFVHMKGGEYFFAPSLNFLRNL